MTITSAPFRDEPGWYSRFQGALLDFFIQYHVDPSQILGAGVSFPGIIDSRRNQVARSHILGVEHMGLERFEKALPCPAVFENDANCACFAERSAGRKNYVYLSLNESVGGRSCSMAGSGPVTPFRPVSWAI